MYIKYLIRRDGGCNGQSAGINMWFYLFLLTLVLNANIVFVPKCQFERAFKLTLASPREWQVGCRDVEL